MAMRSYGVKITGRGFDQGNLQLTMMDRLAEGNFYDSKLFRSLLMKSFKLYFFTRLQNTNIVPRKVPKLEITKKSITTTSNSGLF